MVYLKPVIMQKKIMQIFENSEIGATCQSERKRKQQNELLTRFPEMLTNSYTVYKVCSHKLDSFYKSMRPEEMGHLRHNLHRNKVCETNRHFDPFLWALIMHG